jgi:hypothetical protein
VSDTNEYIVKSAYDEAKRRPLQNMTISADLVVAIIDDGLSLTGRVAELAARILMMATIENNLRGGLKQLDRANRQLRRNYNQSLKNSNEMLEEQNGIIDALKNPWVSVDDRLPKYREVVVIAGPCSMPITGYLLDGAWYEYTCDDGMMGVTHWLPIPPISEGEG